MTPTIQAYPILGELGTMPLPSSQTQPVHKSIDVKQVMMQLMRIQALLQED